MSEALERVIADQQKVIDRLTKMHETNMGHWTSENKKREAMAEAVFGVLQFPESPECHYALKQAIMAYGYCMECECLPCECVYD